jgi:hypothetical protein
MAHEVPEGQSRSAVAEVDDTEAVWQLVIRSGGDQYLTMINT